MSILHSVKRILEVRGWVADQGCRGLIRLQGRLRPCESHPSERGRDTLSRHALEARLHGELIPGGFLRRDLAVTTATVRFAEGQLIAPPRRGCKKNVLHLAADRQPARANGGARDSGCCDGYSHDPQIHFPSTKNPAVYRFKTREAASQRTGSYEQKLCRVGMT
jgi:hypothetical protein